MACLVGAEGRTCLKSGRACSSETAVGFGCWSLGDKAAWALLEVGYELVRRR
jgi:hypothetical protein